MVSRRRASATVSLSTIERRRGAGECDLALLAEEFCAVAVAAGRLPSASLRVIVSATRWRSPIGCMTTAPFRVNPVLRVPVTDSGDVPLPRVVVGDVGTPAPEQALGVKIRRETFEDVRPDPLVRVTPNHVTPRLDDGA